MKILLLLLIATLLLPTIALAGDSLRDDSRDNNWLIDLLWWLRRDGWTGWSHMFGEPDCDCDETVGGGGGGGAG